MGPISAAFGGAASFFCAIDARGRQDIICWGRDGTSLDTGNFASLPPMAALSGGQGFMCGILANTSQAYCWDSIMGSGTELVPSAFRFKSYSHVAAGSSHVCAIRGSYYSDRNSGSVDCWDIDHGYWPGDSNRLRSKHSSFSLVDDGTSIGDHVFERVVSGEGFSCGGIRDGGVVCWGPNSPMLGTSGIIPINFTSLASGRTSVCGISETSGEARCWGSRSTTDNESSAAADPPVGVRFVSLAAGEHHYCGIREDTRRIECWGDFNSSAVPKGYGFFTIASSGYMTCGIRDTDLVLDCWLANETTASPPDYDYDYDPDPPLELCSPGLCSSRSCGFGEFAFNASTLKEPDLTSLCCTESADRVCTSCSLCQNSSCWSFCRLPNIKGNERHGNVNQKLLLIVGPSVSGSLCLFLYLLFFKSKQGPKKQFTSCIGKPGTLESDHPQAQADRLSIHVARPCPGDAQIFRLSELKDATYGFKEFKELGRGRCGFVYKAVLTDGQQVVVKRANAATIIRSNIRDFEMELEVLCKLRHCNIVNLLGYCLEMGERLLVYEYMPHGTLHDHLHGGLSPLNWSLRLKIAMQVAKGLEYLHKEAVPRIVHRDVKTSNILLDSEWGARARLSDFRFSNDLNERELNQEMKSDVYNFGIVLLEMLSSRKAYDVDYSPPDIVQWALPLIRNGRAAAILDRYMALPRNFEPLLKLVDVAANALREDSSERPTMPELALLLEQIVKEGLS
ncbi:hypothetical protein Dimus_034626 [Dionaea muscipula]